MTVPLATMICATKPPVEDKKPAILSPLGKKRYFVVHGGLFSKDEVTLDDIRKIDRIGKQPGQEGIMCASHSFLIVKILFAEDFAQARYAYIERTLHDWLLVDGLFSFCGQIHKKCQAEDQASG